MSPKYRSFPLIPTGTDGIVTWAQQFTMNLDSELFWIENEVKERIQYGATADKPESTGGGNLYYDTDLEQLEVDLAAGWTAVSSQGFIPIVDPVLGERDVPVITATGELEDSGLNIARVVAWNGDGYSPDNIATFAETFEVTEWGVIMDSGVSIHDVAIGSGEGTEGKFAYFGTPPEGFNYQVVAASYGPEDIENMVERAEWGQNGFANRSNVGLSWSDEDLELTVVPKVGTFDYYVAGVKYTVSGPLSKTIDNLEGLYAFYLDGESLNYVANPSDSDIENLIEDQCIVAFVYWSVDLAAGVLFDERHGCVMSPATHHYIHDILGAQYDTGMTPSDVLADQDGSSDTHAQFGILGGAFYDEDYKHTITEAAYTAGLPIYYFDGSDLKWTSDPGFSVISFPVGPARGRLAYNSSGTQAQADDNKYVLCHVFASNIKTSGAGNDTTCIAIQGQEQYATLALARAGANTEIANLFTGDLPMPELVPIATFIFQTRDSYTNTVNARIRKTDTGGDYVDWRGANLVSSGGASATDHGMLSGLTDDDHPQYLLAAGTRALTADWDAGSFEIRAQTFESDVATGTAPLVVASETLVDNLNADLLDGNEATAFAAAIHDHDGDYYPIPDPEPTKYDILMWDESTAVAAASGVLTRNSTLAYSGEITAGNIPEFTSVMVPPPDYLLVDSGYAPADFAEAAHTHADYLNKNGTVALTSDWDAGGFEIRAQTFESDVATGTAPIVVASTTAVTNLNADMVDGDHSSEFFHNNVASEFGSLTKKTALSSSDVFVLEDSEDSNNKKHASFNNIPLGSTTGGGTSLDIEFEEAEGYTPGNNLSVSGFWRANGATGQLTVGDNTPPGGSVEGCAYDNSSTMKRNLYDDATWSSGVVDIYCRMSGNVNQMCGVWLGDSAFTADGIYFGMVTTTGGDTTGFQYASYGTPETYHAHFGTTNASNVYWVRGYVDIDNNLGKMKGWSGAIGDEPGSWNVERTFTGEFPSPCTLGLHTSGTSNASPVFNFWELILSNDSVATATLGNPDHGALTGRSDDDHTQYVLANGNRALSANWDAGGYEIRSSTFESDVTTGTAPLTIASTTVCTNLNADLLDGSHASTFLTAVNPVVKMTIHNGSIGSFAAGDLLYINSASGGNPSCLKADADAESSASKMLVMCNAAINAGSTGEAIAFGYVSGLSSLTAGAIYYVSTTIGGITSTPPSGSLDIVRVVGYALSTTELFFNPDQTYIEIV